VCASRDLEAPQQARHRPPARQPLLAAGAGRRRGGGGGGARVFGSWGVPNYFGPQRFGRFGTNAVDGLRLIRGEHVPGGHRLKRFFLSALQSLLFNHMLAERLNRGLLVESSRATGPKNATPAACSSSRTPRLKTTRPERRDLGDTAALRQKGARERRRGRARSRRRPSSTSACAGATSPLARARAAPAASF
jgi:hypothetical protein